MEQKKIQYAPKLISELLDIIHNAILVIDFRQKIIFANHRTAKMFNTTSSQLQGRHITQLFMPEDREIMVTNILNIIRRDGEYEGEVMFKCDDDNTFLGRIAGTFFKWDNNQDGMAFTIHDITTMKSIQRALRRSERIAFLGTLIDDISHQIRNPVTVIGGFARRIVAEDGGSTEAQAILKESAQLESLLDTLGQFIKLARPVPKRILLKNFIDVAENHLRKTVESMGCSWVCERDTAIKDETLQVDQELLCKALQAVVINSCESYDPTKAADEKPVIFKVKITNDPRLPYTVTVVDHGIGTAVEQLDHVFAHFYSNKTRHVGMGLTFARRIVEEHMGEISIESLRGKGTTITFHLLPERRRLIRTTKIA